MEIADEIRALRALLGENTATFAARWLKSSRTIEDWEQGRSRPEAFLIGEIRKLAARTQKATARKTR